MQKYIIVIKLNFKITRKFQSVKTSIIMALGRKDGYVVTQYSNT